MMKTRYLLSLLAVAVTAVTSARSANVSPTDPSPNVYDPITFEPLAGGVGYAWTVKMGPDDRADLEGLVGAWSWDEDAFPTTAKGWTHTSNWVALNLRKAAKVTIRVSRKLNVPDGQGGVGGNILYPAFTLYKNWDGDGGDDHTYNNRGNVVWAEDLGYLKHVENGGSETVVELTLELEAGNYSIALGGNSPSTKREPFQGYGATIITRPIESPSLQLSGGPIFRTGEHSFSLSGRIKNSEKAKSIVVSSGGHRHTMPVRGSAWTFEADHVEPGRNVIWLTLLDLEDKVADRQRVVIHRRTPKRNLSPRGGGGATED